MTDPRGQFGTLVPLSQAESFGVGGLPEGQRAIPGARGTAEAGQQEFDGGRARYGAEPDILTEAGRQALEASEAVDRYSLSCRTTSIIADWGREPINRVTQRVDTILLQYGRLGFERTIDMTRTEHPAGIAPSRAGHSIGRWENDVLIVDTVGFAPGFLARRLPHSGAELHVVEEFWLDTETQQLKRRYTAEDPIYFTGPYTGEDTLAVSNLPYRPERCEDRTRSDNAELGPR
jgi:hypothetical protein